MSPTEEKEHKSDQVQLSDHRLGSIAKELIPHRCRREQRRYRHSVIRLSVLDLNIHRRTVRGPVDPQREDACPFAVFGRQSTLRQERQ